MGSSRGCPRSCLGEKAAVVKASDSRSIGSLLESLDTVGRIIGIEMVRISSYDVCTLDVVNYCNSHRILVYEAICWDDVTHGKSYRGSFELKATIRSRSDGRQARRVRLKRNEKATTLRRKVELTRELSLM